MFDILYFLILLLRLHTPPAPQTSDAAHFSVVTRVYWLKSRFKGVACRVVCVPVARSVPRSKRCLQSF